MFDCLQNIPRDGMLLNYEYIYITVTQEQTLKDADETAKKNKETAAELEYKLKNAKALRDKELKQAEKSVQDEKKKMDKSHKQMMEKQQVKFFYQCLYLKLI